MALEEQQDKLQAELAATAEPEPTKLRPNMAGTYRRKMAALHAVLEDENQRRDGKQDA